MPPEPLSRRSFSATLALYQITDSALPVGSYAYSQGLESASQYPFVGDFNGVQSYVTCYAKQICHSDLPYVASAHALNLNLNNTAALSEMLMDYNCFVTIPSMREASIHQGQNMLRLFATLDETGQCQKLSDWARSTGEPTHNAVIYGLCLRQDDMTITQTLQSFLYAAIRDQVGAAIRLNLLGPLQAATFLRRLLPLLESLVSQVTHDYHHAYRSSPLIDIMQGQHHLLHTRLFQS